MRKYLVGGVAGFSLALLGVAAWLVVTAVEDSAPTAKSWQSLVTVRVGGSKAPFAPDLIDIISARPDRKMDEAKAAGARSTESPETLVYQRTSFAFTRPEFWGAVLKGMALSDGDVIYNFSARTPDEKRALLEQCARLVKRGEIVLPDGWVSPIYEIRPHRFIRVLLPNVVFRCSMHPQEKLKEDQPCPRCGMTAFRDVEYRYGVAG